jgi:hypothetical protein
MAKKRPSREETTDKADSASVPEMVAIKSGKSRSAAVELGSPVAAIVNLENILIEECFAKRTVEGFRDPAKTDVIVGVEDAGISRAKDAKRFHVHLKFVLRAFNKEGGEKAEEKDRKPAVEITCRFVLVYGLPSFDGLTDENFAAFGSTSGVFSVWPYWREYVHSTSLRLSVPPLVLPTFRV